MYSVLGLFGVHDFYLQTSNNIFKLYVINYEGALQFGRGLCFSHCFSETLFGKGGKLNGTCTGAEQVSYFNCPLKTRITSAYQTTQNLHMISTCKFQIIFLHFMCDKLRSSDASFALVLLFRNLIQTIQQTAWNPYRTCTCFLFNCPLENRKTSA